VGLSGCDSRQQELTRKVDALMQAYQGEVPGASVLVLKDGAPLIRRAYGLADLAPRTAATPATNYRLASMTKEFTAAAVLLLAQEGRLSLDDVLTRWLPHLPPVADNITIRELLNHTSGVIDYEELMAKDTQVPLHDSDVLHLLEAQNRTYFPPGSAYRYSDSGYALLALIVARVSGGDFASFLRQRIFLPLQMRNSVAYEAGISSVADRAFGYSLEDGAWVIEDGQRFRTGESPEPMAELRLPTSLTSTKIEESLASPDTMSFWELPGFIALLEQSGFTAQRHRLHFNVLLARPFLFCAMVLVAATFSLRMQRRGGAGMLIVSGVLAGFLLYFLSDIVFALGLSAKIPVLLAAWTPTGISMIFGSSMLLHLEDG